MVILFNPVIQIFNQKYFNKTDQTGYRQQEINILQSRIVGAAFIRRHFFRQSATIDRLLEKSSSSHFIPMLGQMKSMVYPN